MSITGGSFDLGGSPGSPNPWSGFSVANLLGSYQSLGSAFSFFNTPVNLYTSDGTAATTPNANPAVTGGPIPTATVDTTAGTITADLSAWTANWGITNFNQGAPAVTGTWDKSTGAYDISWSSTVVGGAFAGQTGNWSLQGVAAVPEPETYAMMLAGLGVVVASARRKASKRIS